jgi:hypothetical protein
MPGNTHALCPHLAKLLLGLAGGLLGLLAHARQPIHLGGDLPTEVRVCGQPSLLLNQQVAMVVCLPVGMRRQQEVWMGVWQAGASPQCCWQQVGDVCLHGCETSLAGTV